MRPGKGEKGMGSYIPTTEEQRQRMLETVGLTSTEELFAALPEEVKLKGELQLPKGPVSYTHLTLPTIRLV